MADSGCAWDLLVKRRPQCRDAWSAPEADGQDRQVVQLLAVQQRAVAQVKLQPAARGANQ